MSSSAQAYIAGFWRRLFAFFIDSILVGIFCWVIASVSGDLLFKFPIVSIFVGYLIVILYFGLLNSHLHQGQTFAKQLLKIQVTQINGEYLAVLPSLLRAAILFAPTCLMSISNYMPATLAWGCTSLLAILQCLIVYFYLFNRHNRRSVHDFIAQSVVINTSPQPNQTVAKMWNKHLYFAGAFVLVSFTYSIWMFIEMGDFSATENPQLKSMQPEIISIKEIGDPNPEFTLRMFEIQVNDPKTLNNPFFAQQFVDNLQRLRPTAFAAKTNTMIVLISKFQFGLASKSHFNMYSVDKNEQGQNIAVEQMSSLDF